MRKKNNFLEIEFENANFEELNKLHLLRVLDAFLDKEELRTFRHGRYSPAVSAERDLWNENTFRVRYSPTFAFRDFVYRYFGFVSCDGYGVYNGIQVKGVVYTRDGKEHDFLHELQNNVRPRTLYIMNDNDRRRGNGGNARIREYTYRSILEKTNDENVAIQTARAVGVCTGYMDTSDNIRAYRSLDANNANDTIGKDIEDIRKLLKTNRFDTIHYSASERNGSIGVGIFRREIGQGVVNHITEQLRSLSNLTFIPKFVEEEDGSKLKAKRGTGSSDNFLQEMEDIMFKLQLQPSTKLSDQPNRYRRYRSLAIVAHVQQLALFVTKAKIAARDAAKGCSS